jgi:hypothetical protein
MRKLLILATVILSCASISHAQSTISPNPSGTGGASPGGASGSIQTNNGSGGLGSIGCLGATNPLIACTQAANGNDTVNSSRFTDTTPTGTFLNFMNAAKNATLFSVDVLGNVTANSYQTNGAGAGYFQCSNGNGTLPTIVAGAIQDTCPSGAITGYQVVRPTVAGTGCYFANNVANVVTFSFAACGGTVTSGLQYQMAYYPANGASVSGDPNITTDAANDLQAAGAVITGANPPACAGVGVGGSYCGNEGSAPTPVANVDDWHMDNTQHAMEVNNNNTGEMALSRVNCVNITPVTLPGTSTTADQNLQSCTLSGNLLNVVGRTLKIHTAGVYTTASASTAAMTLEAKLCTVSLCGSGVVVDLCDITSSTLGAATIANDTWTLDCWASTQTAGTSSVYERSGELAIDLLVSNVAADSVFLDSNATTVTAPVIDSTAQLFLQISMAFSVANAANVATGRQLIVEVLN